MFDRILIANRGEIACRVIQTARKMGIGTVAVYSDADEAASHVLLADEAVRLGPAPVAESYLRGDLIIKAALDTGAKAVHPGYGFLSENPDFVDSLEAAGLTFIGPSAKAIRSMGLKDAAKALMEKAGVPVVPGYHGADQSDLARHANDIGFPVLIKAVAGGGGKGMRKVDHADDFADALASAKAEAKTAFGNDAVLIEKYIEKPRHIEVQVFGDGTKAVHLFERDCSLQRRHQKVIEEAPAPGMTPEMRKSMCAAAVRAAEAIDYAGAGTIEFIVDGSNGLRPDGYWFMEMNTRLQVEHPVTEAITGIDLVEWQLRVASGEALPCEQDDIEMKGHAFEARLYAEDVPAGFLPATGQLSHLSFPQDARIDSGVTSGSVISPWYDPMIAKITVAGADRSTALRKLNSALNKTEVAGCVTNLGFLQRLSQVPEFVSGDVDTGLIERGGADLIHDKPATAEQWIAAVLAATGLNKQAPAHAGFSLWQHSWQHVHFAGKTVPYRLMHGRLEVELDGQCHMATLTSDQWRLSGRLLPAAKRDGLRVSVFGADPCDFELTDPLSQSSDQASSDDIRAPMPGLIRDVAVKPGDSVEEGDRLIILEAMKMEHVLKAPRSGQIASVSNSVDDQVAAGDILIKLEADE